MSPFQQGGTPLKETSLGQLQASTHILPICMPIQLPSDLVMLLASVTDAGLQLSSESAHATHKASRLSR